jgi:hypothetical protein
MRANFYWQPYKYFPYEQDLAARELRSLLGQEPVFHENGLTIEVATGWKAIAQRTTYFREAVADDGSRVIPLQAALEASTRSYRQPVLFDVVSSGNLPDADVLTPAEVGTSSLLSRQNTRYSAHGLHEYRGKFNPQIVRVVGNMLGFQQGSWILDPFCGSGTTLLEAVHMGWNAVSVDINPLSILIARAKIAAMHLPLEELRTQTGVLSQKLRKRFKNVHFEKAFTAAQIQSLGGQSWHTSLPFFEYLSSWFTESVLVQLAVILEEIALIPSENLQLLFRIILSDILREVSLQDPADLRIRRRKSPSENAPAVSLFLQDLKKKIETIVQARYYIAHITSMQYALLGDARHCDATVRGCPDISRTLEFDGAITSPPYATALPYIDTQRLSLVLLGLVRPEEIRATEKNLTGNREITVQERLLIEQAIDTNADQLPAECIALCRQLKAAYDKDKDGFRRRNVAALLYKYLVDMALVFQNIHPLLKADAPFALVVGKNQSRLGGQMFTIDTPHLLVLLAEHHGFTLQELLELNTYQRFDVHQGNSIRSEILIVLRKAEYADRSYSTD